MISVDDARILLSGVDVVDVGDGPVVALSHGAGGGVRENFGPLLASAGHRWTGPYLPGAGRTPLADAPLSIDLLADRVAASGVLAGRNRFPVLGLSLGAAVAVTAAVRHPEHVSTLVLTVGLVHPDAQVRSVAATWRALAASDDPDALAAYLVQVSGSADDLGALSGDGWRETVALTRRFYPPGGVDHVELVSRTDVRDLLPRIQVPTLVVVGGQDRIVLPATAREFAGIAGAELIEYPTAGHIFGPARAEAWTADVLAFLDRP